MRCTPSTTTRSRWTSTSSTRPCLPLSRPAMTTTRSPFLIRAISDHLRSQRDDAHEALVAQLAAHRAEDAGPARFAVAALEDDGSVLVEADVGTVRTAALLARAHDDRPHDVTPLDVAAGDGVLDGGDDDVADAGVAPAGASEHPDAQDLLGAGVVGDFESRLLLDHWSLLVNLVLARLASLGELVADNVRLRRAVLLCCRVRPHLTRRVATSPSRRS